MLFTLVTLITDVKFPANRKLVMNKNNKNSEVLHEGMAQSLLLALKHVHLSAL